MKLWTVLFLLVVSWNLTAQTDSAAYGKMLAEYYHYTVPFIQPNELQQKIANGDKFYLLDARESSEYQVSAIQGAIHAGFLFFSKKTVENIDKDAVIVVYCTIGARSETISERLLKNNFTQVYNLYGGIIHWKNLGYPVYQSGAETQNVHVYSKKMGAMASKRKS